MAVTPFQAVQQGGEGLTDIQALAAPPTNSPVPAATYPLDYFNGQFASFSRWIMRSVGVTAFSILEPEQYLNQRYLIHDWTVEGKWQPLAQNIAALTAQATMIAPTLVPNYGQTMDTAQNVYRNIASGGM
jgi:hypothetical protein